MRRVLLVAFATVLISIVTTGSATASEILYVAQQLPCFGAATPLTCFPGGPGFPVLWNGPNYVPFDLPANSLIEEIDLWGDGAQATGIWDSTTPPLNPFTLIPRHEVAAIAPGSIDVTTTLFGIDGINGVPYFFYRENWRTRSFCRMQGGITLESGVLRWSARQMWSGTPQASPRM